MGSSVYEDPNPQYWEGYSNLQHVKHALIREYLKGWFPILMSWAGRVLYIDTHAGRGRHAQGSFGSPLVALKALLDHASLRQLLAASEIRFVFMEQDPENLAALERELAGFGELPRGIVIDRYCADFEEVMRAALVSLRAAGKQMAPSFIFVDPYGFRLPYPLLREFMAFPRVELFINVMWRTLDMALIQARQHHGAGERFDVSFAGYAWRDEIVSSDSEERCDQTVSLVRRIIGSRWATSVRMLGENRATKYVLVHLTNHQRGRDLMKDVMWKVCPGATGDFVARQADNPKQGVLLIAKPDLTPVRQLVLDALQTGPKRWQWLHSLIRDTLWRDPHLNQVVRRLRESRTITATDYTGRFVPSHDPLLALGRPAGHRP